MVILIVDDDLALLNAMKVSLIKLGVEVLAAQSGAQALKAIAAACRRNGSIDCLITDLVMPEMNGFELIRSARQLIADLPAVLITAYGDEHIRQETKTIGHSCFLEKPFKPQDLLKALNELDFRPSE